jgi:ribosomal protein S4
MFVKFQVEHGHVNVNGNPITKAAHLVRPGDRVETRS